MSSRLKIYPYKMYSQSAKALSSALGCKRIIPGGRYSPKSGTKIVNWGSSTIPFTGDNVLNKAHATGSSSNKLRTFQILKNAGVSVPDFTTDINEAKLWQQRGWKVLARHKLSSHSGQGIQVVKLEEPMPHAPLYVKYIAKQHEYRVHVFKGKIIDVIEKRRRYGYDNINSFIRTINNGWVFCRDNIVCSDNIKNLCLSAIFALGLDIGAVDVIEKDGKIYILEVNSAPGLQGTTLVKYVEAIKSWAREGGATYALQNRRRRRDY